MFLCLLSQLSFPLFEGRGLNPIPAEPMGIAKGAKDTQNLLW
jgi:hypothetical protein